MKPTTHTLLAAALCACITSCVSMGNDNAIDAGLSGHAQGNAEHHAMVSSAPHPVVDLAKLKAINAGGAR